MKYTIRTLICFPKFFPSRIFSILYGSVDKYAPSLFYFSTVWLIFYQLFPYFLISCTKLKFPNLIVSPCFKFCLLYTVMVTWKAAICLLKEWVSLLVRKQWPLIVCSAHMVHKLSAFKEVMSGCMSSCMFLLESTERILLKYTIRGLYKELYVHFDIHAGNHYRCLLFHKTVLCKECICVLWYGLQHSRLVLGMLKQLIMELVALKCDFSDWLGIWDLSH